MTHPLGSIKDLATDTLRTGVTLPARVAARAYGVAKGAASIGVRAVTEQRQPQPTSTWQDATTETPTSEPPTSETLSSEPPTAEPLTTEPPTPVNVVEELGLDPAPVDTTPDSAEPITSIDAQADPEQVEVTPADLAERLARPDES